jgi:hypothetical protein
VRRLAADDPAHRRIMTQALGIVHILVSGEATENGLTQQTDKRMAAVLARTHIGERIACNHRQAEHVIEQVLEAVVEGINTGNFETLMALYEPEGGKNDTSEVLCK